MNKKKLSSWQFAFLVVYPILSLYNGISNYNIIHSAGVDSYLVILIAYLFGLGVSFLFFFIFQFRPQENILEKNIYLFGKYIGTFINLIINTIFLIIGMFLLYSISIFTTSQFLDQTPIPLFMIVIGVIIILNVCKGIVNMSRVAVVFLGIVIFLSVVSIFGLIPHFEIDNLLPFLHNGITPIVDGSYQMFFINIVPIFLLLIIKSDVVMPQKHLKKRIFILYTISFVIIILDNMLTIGTLGIYLAKLEQYPEYMVLQKISLFHFLDRIEMIIYIKWFLASFVCLSLIVYHICRMFRQTHLRVSSCVVLSTMAIFSLLFFPTNTYFYYFGYHYLPAICLLLFSIYMIIGCVIIIKKKY